MESKGDDAPPLPEFDVVSCSSMCRLPHNMPIEACTLSADARTFYSTTMDGNVCATWVQAGREKRTFGVDGMLATGVVWASDLLLCEPLLMVAGAIELGPGSFQGVIKSYDLTHYSDDCVGTFMGHTGRVRSIDVPGRLVDSDDGKAFTPRILVSGADDGTVRFWDVPEARCIVEVQAHEEGVHVVKGDPVNKNLAYTAGKDGVVKLWDVRERRCAATFTVPEEVAAAAEGAPRPIADLALTSDGARLFSGAGAGGARAGIVEWDKRKRSFVRNVGWHEAPILSMAIACEDTMLVTVSRDGTMQCRDLRPTAKGGADCHADDPNKAFPVVAEQRLKKDGQEAAQENLPSWVTPEAHAFTALCVPQGTTNSGTAFSRAAGDDEKQCVYTASSDVALREWDLSNLMIDTPLKQIDKENESTETFDQAMDRAFKEVAGHAEARASKVSGSSSSPSSSSSSRTSSAAARKPGRAVPALPETKDSGASSSSRRLVAPPTRAPGEVPAWLKNNTHYKRMKRLKPGELVVLVEGAVIDSQSHVCLEAGEVGQIKSDDNSNTPFEVIGPRGNIGWYEECQVQAAPAGSVFEVAKPPTPRQADSGGASGGGGGGAEEDEEEEDSAALAFYRSGGGLFGSSNGNGRDTSPYELPDAEGDGGQEEKDSGGAAAAAAEESGGGDEDADYASYMPGPAVRTTAAEDREAMQRVDDSMQMYMQQRAAARSARGGDAKAGAKKGGWRDRLNK